MAAEADASGRRARGRRLTVILLVALALLLGALAWRILSNRALDNRTDDATAELRRLWRPVDLDELAAEYSAALTGTNATGDQAAAAAVLPKPKESTFATGDFGRNNRFDGAYAVDTWGRHRCIAIRVKGPAPNQLRFAVNDAECAPKL